MNHAQLPRNIFTKDYAGAKKQKSRTKFRNFSHNNSRSILDQTHSKHAPVGKQAPRLTHFLCRAEKARAEKKKKKKSRREFNNRQRVSRPEHQRFIRRRKKKNEWPPHERRKRITMAGAAVRSAAGLSRLMPFA